MHKGILGYWDFTLTYSIDNQLFKVEKHPIEVTPQPKESHLKFKRFKGKDEKTYFLALISPEEHKNGRNENVIVGLFKAENATHFPQVKDYTIEVDPRMPGDDMQNHSTPFEGFKVQPDGFYKAVINYSMTGLWQLNFIIKDASGQVIAGTEVPKNPKTKEDFNAVSEISIAIDIP